MNEPEANQRRERGNGRDWDFVGFVDKGPAEMREKVRGDDRATEEASGDAGVNPMGRVELLSNRGREAQTDSMQVKLPNNGQVLTGQDPRGSERSRMYEREMLKVEVLRQNTFGRMRNKSSVGHFHGKIAFTGRRLTTE